MTIRFGFLGTSYWGEEVHLPALSSVEGAELVGIWGRNADKARVLADRFGTSAFASIDDLFTRVDAVAIAVAPAAQAVLALKAAEAGKHLFLEKPIAAASPDAERLASAAGRHGVSSVVFFTRRFIPEIEADIEALSKQAWHSCQVRLLSGAMTPGTPYESSIWRQAEGAALWDNGPHVLSILLPILGRVRSVSARTEGRAVHVTTRHESGASADLTLSLHAAPSEQATDYEFRGANATAKLSGVTFTTESRRQACARAMSDLVANASRGERRHRCDVDFGLLGVRILSAAQRSIDTGKAVDVQDGQPAAAAR